MKTTSRGFTLMELMVTLAIAGIVLAIGAPSFRDFMRNNRLVSVANDMLGAAQTARTEAIKRQLPVAVCPSSDGISCTSATAFDGWITFVDTNNDCVRGSGEAIVRTHAQLNASGEGATSKVTAKSNGNCISFAATGFRQAISGKTTASNTVICDSRGLNLQAGTTLSAARGLEVNVTGRSRITRDRTEMVSGPPGSGWGITCP